MHQSITLIALLFSHVSALLLVEEPSPLAIKFPSTGGERLDARVCDYYNEETICLEGFKGNSLVPSEPINSYYLNGVPQGEIPQRPAPAKKDRHTTAGAQ